MGEIQLAYHFLKAANFDPSALYGASKDHALRPTGLEIDGNDGQFLPIRHTQQCVMLLRGDQRGKIDAP